MLDKLWVTTNAFCTNPKKDNEIINYVYYTHYIQRVPKNVNTL